MGGGCTLVLAGDVMTGRGVDQVLPAPGSPRLREEYVVDARSYVALAERVNGSIPRPVPPAWPWGEALEELDAAGAAVRVMNLETAVTRSEELAPGKAIHYRMSPDNLACLEAAHVDVWALANNHVLDHGVPGLLETLEVLGRAGLRTVGAGRDSEEAWSPATVTSPSGHLVVVLAVAHASSGVPPSWAAGPRHPGVALLPDLSEATAERVADSLRGPSDHDVVRVVSVHWGGNWGYDVPPEQRRFAHRLVEAGVHVVHGHSSHHPRPLEVYRGGLVVYGCGDLVNDYEGIGGYERFRDDLRLLYVVHLAPGSARLEQVSLLPFRARRMRLERADAEEAAWLARRMDQVCRPYGTSVRPGGQVTVPASTHP